MHMTLKETEELWMELAIKQATVASELWMAMVKNFIQHDEVVNAILYSTHHSTTSEQDNVQHHQSSQSDHCDLSLPIPSDSPEQ